MNNKTEKNISNLTEGPIINKLLRLSIPIMISSFLITAYNITDMFWIGKLGSKAVAGIGVGGMFVWLSGGLSALTRVGAQVCAAQEIGRNNLTDAKKYVAVALRLIIILGVLFGLTSIFLSDQMISLFDITDKETFFHGKIYLQITCGGIIFSFLINTITGIYTAWGDSVTPLKINFIGLIVNMILDPLLIHGYGFFPRLEAAGAAIATVSAQAFTVVLIIIATVNNNNPYNLFKNNNFLAKTDSKYTTKIIKIGGPIAIQSTVYCGISMVLTKFITVFGAAALAVQKVGGQIESISWNMADGFGSATNTFSAQNYGAGKMNRVKKGYKISALIILLWGLLITVLFLIFPEPISKLFFFEKDAISVSKNYLIIVGLSEPFMCVELLAIGAISGLGKTNICSAISVLLTAIRIPLAYILINNGLGVNGIWWALTISSILKGIILHLTFLRQCKIIEGKVTLQ
ncbi:MAG: MATE family efflux transporter [Lachnospiraceae bacterium]|nr:MATE family efflux transporter [Lachnospiraceae bacterium]